jgi:hypothetical protein
MTKDIILNSIMTKPLTIEVSIAELIGVTNDEIKQVAKASNGEFIKDRRAMKALDFLAKYFPTKQLQVTSYEDIVEQRAPIIGTKTKAGVKKEKKAVGQDEIGHYVVALFESGDEFAVTYRKLDYAQAHFEFSMNTMTYKKDGRRFTMIGKHGSRKEAIAAKTALVEEMTTKGKTHLIGVLPV